MALIEAGAIAIHATALICGEAAVVIRGPSGVGKSRLAHILMAEAGRRGRFSRLVGDDRVLVRPFGSSIVVSAHPAIAGLLERRTQPIACVSHEPRGVVRLVVDLYPASAPLPRYPEGDVCTAELAGLDGMPLLRLQGPPDALSCHFVLEALGAA